MGGLTKKTLLNLFHQKEKLEFIFKTLCTYCTWPVDTRKVLVQTQNKKDEDNEIDKPWKHCTKDEVSCLVE